MRRLRLAALAPVVVVVLVLGLAAGCSSSEESGGTEAPSPEPSSEAPTSSPTPTVAPASGPEISRPAATARLPEGWEAEKNPGAILVVGRDPVTTSSIFLSQVRTLDAESKTLESLAETDAKSGYDGRGTIEAETTLADVPVYHVSGQFNGEDVDVFGTIVDRDIVTLEFSFDAGVRDELQEEIIAEVFAGFEWNQ